MTYGKMPYHYEITTYPEKYYTYEFIFNYGD